MSIAGALWWSAVGSSLPRKTAAAFPLLLDQSLRMLWPKATTIMLVAGIGIVDFPGNTNQVTYATRIRR
jgi:hypothetical protein